MEYGERAKATQSVKAGSAMTTIRPPAVAGSFYPDDPAILSAVVEDFLAEVPGPLHDDPLDDGPLDDNWPKALIAPHAGYIYSGPVAASAASVRSRAAERRRTRMGLVYGRCSDKGSVCYADTP